MKKFGIIAIIVAIATAFSVSQVWKVVEPEKIKVHFELPSDGTTGTFSGFKAEIHFDKSDLSKSKIEAVIDAKTVDTKNTRRDDHLRNADFFEVDKYPTISFVSSEIIVSENGFTAKGNLTMKDKVLPIEVPFQFIENEAGKASLKGKMSVKPFDWGVIGGEENKNEVVNITVEVPLTK